MAVSKVERYLKCQLNATIRVPDKRFNKLVDTFKPKSAVLVVVSPVEWIVVVLILSSY